ncbi:MAG: hypothetical protein WAM71_11755, partial [Candidatus Korobacteraceae bacterium]
MKQVLARVPSLPVPSALAQRAPLQARCQALGRGWRARLQAPLLPALVLAMLEQRRIRLLGRAAQRAILMES